MGTPGGLVRRGGGIWEHVGTVDKTAGDRIILTKADSESGGVHHSLSCSDVDRVEGDRVILDCSASDARRRWLVRLLRLAGGAPLPEFFEIDDSLVTGGAEVSGADMLHFTSGGDAPGEVA